MSLPSVRYWIFNYKPEWEAVSKEIDSLRRGLSDVIDESIVSLNTVDRRLRLRGPEKRVPLPLGLALLPLLKPYASRAGINHLFASAGERWLTPRLATPNGMLTVAKDTDSLPRIERNADIFQRYGAIVVQCERDRDLMRQLGVRPDSIRLIRPGIPIAPYREGRGAFTILFASSPLRAAHFMTRGIYLMIRTAARLPDVHFLLIWRRRQLAKLRGLIAEAGVSNIEVQNGVISDMEEVYDRVHATILPGLEHCSFIPCPRSGLESLAHGKPLLASRLVSIAELVAQAGAGVAFEPTLQAMEDAIRHLRNNYITLQQGTQACVRANFSSSTHLELYRRLYQGVGA